MSIFGETQSTAIGFDHRLWPLFHQQLHSFIAFMAEVHPDRNRDAGFRNMLKSIDCLDRYAMGFCGSSVLRQFLWLQFMFLLIFTGKKQLEVM